MRRPHMVVIRNLRPGRSVRLWVLAVIGALLLSLVGTTAPPATASPLHRSADPSVAASAVHQGRPAMCRPEPPDYPGCSPAQVRPLLRARFAAEYTGHADGYRYYRMGQHARGVIFAHLRPALNARLARLYRRAVARYVVQHRGIVIDADGRRHVVTSYPRYPTWIGFRNSVTSFCVVNTVTRHFPVEYCSAITLIGRAGALINQALRAVTRIALSCDGYAVGGWASGSFAAWRLGTGVLAGGFYGAAGVEIGCQTTNLWNWASSLW